MMDTFQTQMVDVVYGRCYRLPIYKSLSTYTLDDIIPKRKMQTSIYNSGISQNDDWLKASQKYKFLPIDAIAMLLPRILRII